MFIALGLYGGHIGVILGGVCVSIYIYIYRYRGVLYGDSGKQKATYSIPKDAASVQFSAHVVCKTDVVRMLRPVFLAGPVLAIPMPFRTTPDAKP